MTRILIDSSAGLTISEVKDYGVEMLPIAVAFGDEEFLDGVDISFEDFYNKMENSKFLPKTSAINQTRFEEIFNDAKKKGDEMVVIGLAKGLSTTYEQSLFAKEAVGYDKIYIVNTKNVLAGLVAMIDAACKMQKAGKSGKQIADELNNNFVEQLRHYFYVPSLKYLRAGGRVSAASAAIGTLLNVKPILIVEKSEGRLQTVGKAVGVKKAQEYLLKQLANKDVDLSRPVFLSHANALKDAQEILETAQKKYGATKGLITNASATIGAHTGPGLVSMAFFVK